MSQAIVKLQQQIEQLAQHAHQFDKAKWFDKNRYIQAQPSLFAHSVFATKSLKLCDYVDEIKEALAIIEKTIIINKYKYLLYRIHISIINKLEI